MGNFKLIVVDVDGTLTDSGIYYDENGNEIKKFTTKDAVGFWAAQAVGMIPIVCTGRVSEATEKRMKELNVEKVFQNVKDKAAFLSNYMKENNIKKEEVIYVGDELNDLESMKLCGFVACPNDSCPEVKKIAQYVSSKNGGQGVLRDVVEYILKERGIWEQIVAEVYSGI